MGTLAYNACTALRVQGRTLNCLRSLADHKVSGSILGRTQNMHYTAHAAYVGGFTEVPRRTGRIRDQGLGCTSAWRGLAASNRARRGTKRGIAEANPPTPLPLPLPHGMPLFYWSVGPALRSFGSSPLVVPPHASHWHPPSQNFVPRLRCLVSPLVSFRICEIT